MIERDDNIPPLDELLEELSIARTFAETTLTAADSPYRVTVENIV
jgi:uncharacterized protein (UPF0276 family)